MSVLADEHLSFAPLMPVLGSSRQEIHDFDEQAALLRGWNQDYAQLSSGAFNGYVAEMQFDDVHLFLEYTSQALFQSGKLGEDVVAVGVPLSAQSHGMFCGGISSAESMHVFSGEGGFEFISPTELVMGGISIGRHCSVPWPRKSSSCCSKTAITRISRLWNRQRFRRSGNSCPAFSN